MRAEMWNLAMGVGKKVPGPGQAPGVETDS